MFVKNLSWFAPNQFLRIQTIIHSFFSGIWFQCDILLWERLLNRTQLFFFLGKLNRTPACSNGKWNVLKKLCESWIHQCGILGSISGMILKTDPEWSKIAAPKAKTSKFGTEMSKFCQRSESKMPHWDTLLFLVQSMQQVSFILEWS